MWRVDWHVERGIVAVACVGHDMIKVWPLPVEGPWFEELAGLTGEHVQQIADYESARTTGLYSRTAMRLAWTRFADPDMGVSAEGLAAVIRCKSCLEVDICRRSRENEKLGGITLRILWSVGNGTNTHALWLPM
jgi:hypothetical protein